MTARRPPPPPSLDCALCFCQNTAWTRRNSQNGYFKCNSCWSTVFFGSGDETRIAALLAGLVRQARATGLPPAALREKVIANRAASAGAVGLTADCPFCERPEVATLFTDAKARFCVRCAACSAAWFLGKPTAWGGLCLLFPAFGAIVYRRLHPDRMLGPLPVEQPVAPSEVVHGN